MVASVFRSGQVQGLFRLSVLPQEAESDATTRSPLLLHRNN
jgi:hypothetical protein